MATSPARRASEPLHSHSLRRRRSTNPLNHRHSRVACGSSTVAPRRAGRPARSQWSNHAPARRASDPLPRHRLRHRLCTNPLNRRHLLAACGSSTVVPRRAGRCGWTLRSPIATASARLAADPLHRHCLRQRLWTNPLNHRRLLAACGSSAVVRRRVGRPATALECRVRVLRTC
jgi:hypothetical protein